MSSRTSTITTSPFLTPASSPIQQAEEGAHKRTDIREPEHCSRRNIAVQLQYLKDDPLYQTVKPLQIVPGFADKEGRSNVRLAPGPLETLHDVRGSEHNFTLDQNGFQYVKAPTNFTDWSSQPSIAKQYLPEMESLLKREVEGCDEILFYDARIRQESDEGVRVEGLSYNPFARQVHVDVTEPSVITKIRQLTEMKADYLLTGRCRIINIWRPIKHPVYDCGLAIADAGKLLEGDVIECDRVRKDTGEFWDTMGVIKYREGYDWYYCSEQREEDVLLFKNYDSASDMKTKIPLHSAFDVPLEHVPPDAPTRESIEVRALVFTYPADRPRPSDAATRHHLADLLKQSNLQRLDDEYIGERIIHDHIRTDIDEGRELKDAELIFRQQKIRRLKEVRDALEGDLADAHAQIRVQDSTIKALETEVSILRAELRRSVPSLRDDRKHLARQLADTRMSQQSALHQAHAQSENIQQTIHRLEFEKEMWRKEAMGNGAVAVSRSWQGSVDEAVRREREKDAFVIRDLRAEIVRLKMIRSE